MVALTPISRKPMSLVVPTVAASGAFAGLFVGTAQGSGLMGIVIGAALLAVIALIAMQNIMPERTFRWIILAGFAIAGVLIGGLPALLIGLIFGWFFGWFTYWLYSPDYSFQIAGR